MPDHPSSAPAAKPVSPPARKRPAPRDAAAPFEPHELFFSTTDRKGFITYGNDVFVRVSGYDRGELTGAPHNVIRHPDMPRAVFQLLWDELLAGRPVVAYVKNLAATGCYYWVCAMVTPIEGGFLSIRLKPSGPLFPTVQDLYRVMLDLERTTEAQGGSRKEAIAASTARLNEAVRSLGMDDYASLGNELLVTEVTSRKRRVAGSTRGGEGRGTGTDARRAACDRLTEVVGAMYAKVGSFVELERELKEKAAFLRQLGTALQRLSMNAQVRASNLAQDGATLQVIAGQMNGTARALSESSAEVCRYMEEVTGVLRGAAGSIVTSDLSVEMMSSFLAELSLGSGTGGGERDALQRVAQLAEVVGGNLAATCRAAGEAAGHIVQLERRLEDFVKQVRTLEILHVTGRVEAVRCGQGRDVSLIFEEVYGKTREAREKLSGLAELTARARFAPPDLSSLRPSLAYLQAPAQARAA